MVRTALSPAPALLYASVVHVFATACRWIGRALILGAIYVLVCAFFLPQGIQFLNSAACPKTLELDNARYSPPGEPDNERLELVCTSSEASQSAARSIGLIVAGSVAVGLALLYVAQRRSTPTIRVPSGPPVT
jgi:hypothetical protein